ncbi:MAG: hypothetical protein PHH20_01315 [Candidatus Omnitrophica bacterium]|nr:hypothetical protein [Candidatus Omnitrophota bacterium]
MARMAVSFAVSFVLAAVFALVPSGAYAHAPSLVDVSMTDSGRVQVVVTHAVGSPKTHYIYKLEVFVNGEKVDEKEYKEQVGNQQVDSFGLAGLKEGDKVSVRAYCIRGGDHIGEMTVE